jgi:hypothetical protein
MIGKPRIPVIVILVATALAVAPFACTFKFPGTSMTADPAFEFIPGQRNALPDTQPVTDVGNPETNSDGQQDTADTGSIPVNAPLIPEAVPPAMEIAINDVSVELSSYTGDTITDLTLCVDTVFFYIPSAFAKRSAMIRNQEIAVSSGGTFLSNAHGFDPELEYLARVRARATNRDGDSICDHSISYFKNGTQITTTVAVEFKLGDSVQVQPGQTTIRVNSDAIINFLSQFETSEELNAYLNANVIE